MVDCKIRGPQRWWDYWSIDKSVSWSVKTWRRLYGSVSDPKAGRSASRSVRQLWQNLIYQIYQTYTHIIDSFTNISSNGRPNQRIRKT